MVGVFVVLGLEYFPLIHYEVEVCEMAHTKGYKIVSKWISKN